VNIHQPDPSLPLVTVCVPAHNAVRTLARTLDSILAQDYPSIEIIVSDYASTDQTAALVQQYAARGVRYVYNAVGENWNSVLTLAASPLVALYHADDLYSPTMISRQVAFLQTRPNVCAVFTMSQGIDEADRPIRQGTMRLPSELYGQSCCDFPTLFNAILKHTDFICTPTMLARRETFEAVGNFNYAFASALDLDLWLRMARWRPIGIIDEPLHRYRISPQQGSAQMESTRTFEAHYFAVMDHYLAIPEVRACAQADALRFYEMQRSIDRVGRALRLLINGQTTEAGALLQRAQPWKHFATARQRPYRLRQLLLGCALWLATRLKLGAAAGRVAQALYQMEIKRRQQPLHDPGRDHHEVS
jgi:glycosyltransferase involved in cell wall biosynthesis